MTAKERPLNLRADEVRAVLDGTKTQMRRLMKPQPKVDHGLFLFVDPLHTRLLCVSDRDYHGHLPLIRGRTFHVPNIRCPFGVLRDRLWVRESWCQRRDGGVFQDGKYWYAADGVDIRKVDGDGAQEFWKDGTEASPWVSPVRMPREASRLALEIVEVSVHRVQEISEQDAVAEGVAAGDEDAFPFKCAFASLWDSLHAKRGFGWDANPWVWVVTFKKVRNAEV